MSNKMKKILIVVNIVLLFVITGFSAQKEESYKKLDSYFYLELRPVDPRSLLQGDYMTLNYDILDQTTEFIYQNKSYDYYEEERKEETKEQKEKRNTKFNELKEYFINEAGFSEDEFKDLTKYPRK